MNWMSCDEMRPEPLIPVLVYGPTLPTRIAVAVWHRMLGVSGDFGVVTLSKRGAIKTLDHLPGVTHWRTVELPQASGEPA